MQDGSLTGFGLKKKKKYWSDRDIRFIFNRPERPSEHAAARIPSEADAGRNCGGGVLHHKNFTNS